MRLSIAFSYTLLGALTASAATITGFTATPTSGSPFILTGPTVTFAGSTGVVTNSSVSCATAGGCTGGVLDFTIQGIGSPTLTPFSVNIDGTITPSTNVSGTLAVPALMATFPFVLTPDPTTGMFSNNIVNRNVPSAPNGAFSFAGTFGLTLAQNQTLTLPSSLSFTVGAPTTVPEPGSAMLVGGALLGIVGLLKRRRARA
ncbi:MAG: PEP-CTERM sorting domain-containing protein [Bryobacteraceae bacterium]